MRSITITPGVAFGRPMIGGTPVFAVAGRVQAGESVESVASDYDLTPTEVCLACWHEAERSWVRGISKAWDRWSEGAYNSLARGERPTDPPARERP